MSSEPPCLPSADFVGPAVAQVVRAGAWSMSSKGWVLNSHSHIRAKPLGGCWDQAGHFLPGPCNLDSQWSFLSHGHTEYPKLVSSPSPLKGHCLAPAPCGEDSVGSPGQCWACGRAADSSRGAVCVQAAIPGGRGVTISTELPTAFPAPSLMCLQNTYVGSALFSFLGAHRCPL